MDLVDGGVYDNLGLDWFVRASVEGAQRPFTDFVVVVDASGQLKVDPTRFGARRMIPRTLKIQYAQTLAPRVSEFFSSYLGKPYRGSYVSLSSYVRSTHHAWEQPMNAALAASALPDELVYPLTQIRTDLDRFDVLEADLLSYHGYWSMHSAFAYANPELAIPNPKWVRPDWGAMSPQTLEAMDSLLIRGSHRFLRRFRGRNGRLFRS